MTCEESSAGDGNQFIPMVAVVREGIAAVDPIVESAATDLETSGLLPIASEEPDFKAIIGVECRHQPRHSGAGAKATRLVRDLLERPGIGETKRGLMLPVTGTRAMTGDGIGVVLVIQPPLQRNPLEPELRPEDLAAGADIGVHACILSVQERAVDVEEDQRSVGGPGGGGGRHWGVDQTVLTVGTDFVDTAAESDASTSPNA